MLTSGKIYGKLQYQSEQGKKQNKTGIPEVHKKLPMLSEHLEEDQSQKPTLEKEKCEGIQMETHYFFHHLPLLPKTPTFTEHLLCFKAVVSIWKNQDVWDVILAFYDIIAQ